MQVTYGLENFTAFDRPLYLALGNFDGVHKGHQELINTAVEQARRNNGISGALIFDPHPLKILNPNKRPLLLLNNNQQIEVLKRLGLDYLIYSKFNKEIAALAPEKFVQDFLVDKLHVAGVVVGFNHSFGYKGAGKPDLLVKLGEQHGFAVTVIDPIIIDNHVVSSSLIRLLLAEGDIEAAKEMLGYYPEIEGVVLQGEKRGRTIGISTANVGIESDYAIPGNGVYAAMTQVEGKNYYSVVNIGNKLTFHDEFPTSIESHIIDFNHSIYGQKIKLYFLEKIRDERKFSSADELVVQIMRDREKALEICKQNIFL